MLLVHIGMFRTGSTWLQKKVWVNPRMPFNSSLPPLDTVRDQFVTSSPFIKQTEACSQVFLEQIACMDDEKKIGILSYECLSGHPYSGGFNSFFIAEQLKNIFPNAKILLIIREQRSHLKSIYKKYIKEGGNRTFKNFVAGGLSVHNIQFNEIYFQHHHLITKLNSLFGQENVMVLPFEYLKENATDYVLKILGFCGVQCSDVEVDINSINRSSRNGLINLQRFVNKLNCNDPVYGGNLPIEQSRGHNVDRLIEFVNKYVPPVWKSKVEKGLEDDVESWCLGRFEEDNLKTSGLIGIDLKSYGYLA